jgi:hypothetical protein
LFNFPGYKRDANQTTLTFHLTPVRMAIFKGKTTSNDDEDVVTQELLHADGGNANLYSHYGKAVWRVLKKLS